MSVGRHRGHTLHLPDRGPGVPHGTYLSDRVPFLDPDLAHGPLGLRLKGKQWISVAFYQPLHSS